MRKKKSISKLLKKQIAHVLKSKWSSRSKENSEFRYWMKVQMVRDGYVRKKEE